MSERVRFIGHLLDGERMSDLCLEFGISRKTGYKLYRRYQEEGIEGLANKCRLPHQRPNETPSKVVKLITDVREQHPTRGAPKIKQYLQRKHSDLKIPAKSTVHSILVRTEMIQKQTRQRRFQAQGTSLSVPERPNELWCADFKGQFRMQNRQYCYPLTITDQRSRFLLGCEALENVKEAQAYEVFGRVFQEYGLPERIRTDNGVPFATRSLFGLSALSVWWLRLGIRLERIEPEHPEQNGQHERMHRTLKETVIGQPAKNILQQQETFDDFRSIFNHERPHQALEMKCPSELYVRSERTYSECLDEIKYSSQHQIKRVNDSGTISIAKKTRVFISEVFRGQMVGVKELDDGIWGVDFMAYTIGYFVSRDVHMELEPDLPFAKCEPSRTWKRSFTTV